MRMIPNDEVVAKDVLVVSAPDQGDDVNDALALEERRASGPGVR